MIEDDVNVDDEASDVSENTKKKKSVRLRRARANARLKGCRKLALSAGFTKCGGSGFDVLQPLLSSSDTKKLMRSAPTIFNKGTYLNKDEGQDWQDLALAPLGKKAVVSAQMAMEVEGRDVFSEAVALAYESGKQRIDAAVMESVLRRRRASFDFTSISLPEGVKRFALKQGALHGRPEDVNVDKSIDKLLIGRWKKMKGQLEAEKVEKSEKRKMKAAELAANAEKSSESMKAS